MLSILITLLVAGLILAIVWWAIQQVPVPEPFSWVIRVVFAIVVCVVLISILTGGGGEWLGFHGRGLCS